MKPKTTKKNTRFHSKWKIDQDYRKDLSASEREWLDKFNGEYYRCEIEADNSLHPKEQLTELYDAQNAANRDVVTTTGEDIAESQATKATKYNQHLYYPPSAYITNTKTLNPEDAYIEALDNVAN